MRQDYLAAWGMKMIEAVKSTVANSALLKGNVDQSSTLNSFAANPDKLQVASQAPYVSPTVRIDVNTKIAILEFRESLSGEVLAQIPSEQAIRSYKLREAKEDAQIAAQLISNRSGTQKGSAPITTNAKVSESAPVAQPSQDVTPSPAPDITVAAEVEAITTKLDV
ncbi:MAG: hypothetical protein KGQ41_06920 [Alphaproteobacteria bacterium]|nr:hypothetical protein [Alphaproteobacteria bacterium]